MFEDDTGFNRLKEAAQPQATDATERQHVENLSHPCVRDIFTRDKAEPAIEAPSLAKRYALMEKITLDEPVGLPELKADAQRPADADMREFTQVVQQQRALQQQHVMSITEIKELPNGDNQEDID